MDDGNYLFYVALLQTKYTFQGPRGGSDRVRDPNTVRVTTQEKAAIDRVSIQELRWVLMWFVQLAALGFDKRLALEAYLVCNKDENLAANYLFERQLEEGGDSAGELTANILKVIMLSSRR